MDPDAPKDPANRLAVNSSKSASERKPRSGRRCWHGAAAKNRLLSQGNDLGSLAAVDAEYRSSGKDGMSSTAVTARRLSA